MKVSLVVITLNEEKNIERCLRSVSFADEIIVLDSGSSDHTVEIAKREGAKVFVEAFKGFREQKQRATDLASHDWIISLDADEALSPRLAKEIQSLLKNENLEPGGYRVPRLSFHMGRWIRHGGWFPDSQIRFFNRKACKWVGGQVHERVEGDPIQAINAPILHWVFRDLAHQVSTNNLYSSFGARDLLEQNKNHNLLKMITKPISKFFETYFFKRGFLDGLPGFIISVGAAYSIFLKFAKAYEAKRKAQFDANALVLPPEAEI